MGAGLERACREARNRNIEEYKRRKRMINWTNVNDQLPAHDGHYLVVTIAGFVDIQKAVYYSAHHYGSGHFVVDGVIVDATYWAELNLPEEYVNG